MATNTTHTVRQLQRTLYAKAKQAKEVKFSSLYDKVWRADVLWEAWGSKSRPTKGLLASMGNRLRR